MQNETRMALQWSSIFFKGCLLYSETKKKRTKNDVGLLRLAHPTHALRDRNPARHATGESSLQSETSLKCHLHCLGQHGNRRLPMRARSHRGVRAGRRTEGI